MRIPRKEFQFSATAFALPACAGKGLHFLVFI